MSKKVRSVPVESKAEVYQRIETILERGPFVTGTRAVHRTYFLYTLRWSQVAARICKMNKAGWQIVSVTLPESEWENGIRAAYRLDSKPLQPQAPKTKSDYMRRARQDRERAMPLFARVET